MSSIAQTPATRTAPRVNLRAFLAGGAATTALVLAAIIVFASLAAYVAFNGLPGSGDAAGGNATVRVASGSGGAPAAAAAAAAAAPAAVAAAPAAPAAAPAGDVLAAAGGGTASGADPGGATAPGAGGTAPTAGGTTPATEGAGTATVAPAATAPAEQDGPSTSVVKGLDNTAAGLGVDTDLNGATAGLTGTLDDVVEDTLNQAGGSVGNGTLGTQVSQGVTNATDAILGAGGLTDTLLNH